MCAKLKLDVTGFSACAEAISSPSPRRLLSRFSTCAEAISSMAGSSIRRSKRLRRNAINDVEGIIEGAECVGSGRWLSGIGFSDEGEEVD
nr:hypothetical protein Iba_chr04aCG21610 [Ipomoea batatas]